MKKYRCECSKAKCEVEREDKFNPKYCTCFCTKDPNWQEIKEEEKTEVKAEELPSWCKVGEVIYNTDNLTYFKIAKIDNSVIYGRCLDNGIYEYKIKHFAQARLRPYNAEEMKELVGKTIASKTTKTRYLIVTSNLTSVSAAGYIYDEKELLNGFIFTDGTPCGVYEHKENGEWVE